MCRWMGWSGQPVDLEELLFKAEHGLIDQSLHSRMGVETTNGDGFGIGWYGRRRRARRRHSVAPAWGDENLRELAAHIESPCSSRTCARPPAPRSSRPTATRSATGAGCSCTTASSTASSHAPRADARRRPRRCSTGDRGLDRLRGAVPPRADLRARGRPGRRARAADRLRRGHRGQARIENPVQTSIGVTDGERLWAFRYSTEARSRTLFVSADGARATRSVSRQRALASPTRTASSSPSRSPTPGAWHEIPESTVADRPAGRRRHVPFHPAPAGDVNRAATIGRTA